MVKETMKAIIALRVYPSWKRKAIEEAEKRGKTLSEFLYELIEDGWNQMNKEEGVQQQDEKTV